MSLRGSTSALPARRRGRIPATNAAVHPSEVPIHGRRSCGLGFSGYPWPRPVRAVSCRRAVLLARGDLAGLLASSAWLLGVPGGDGTIGLRVLLAEHPELVPRGPEQDQLLALLVPVVLGWGEQEGAQAPLLLRPAADDGDLARLEHEVRGQVAERLLLLAVVDLELLGGVGRGVGQGLVRSLDRAVMDLGREPQRDAVAALVRGGHAEVAAGGLVVLAVGPVLAVQEEAHLIDGVADADQRLLAVIEQEGGGLDLVRRRGVEDRLAARREARR